MDALKVKMAEQPAEWNTGGKFHINMQTESVLLSNSWKQMYIYLFTIKYNVRDTFTADIFAGVTSNINDDPNLKMSAVKNTQCFGSYWQRWQEC